MTNSTNQPENNSVNPNKGISTNEMNVKRSNQILLKIDVVLRVNYYKKQICKIIFKEGNELKSVCMAIKSFQNNFVVLENGEQILVNKILDINY